MNNSQQTNAARVLIAARCKTLAPELASILTELRYGVEITSFCLDSVCRIAEQKTPDLVMVDMTSAATSEAMAAASRIRSELGFPVIYVIDVGWHVCTESPGAPKPCGYVIRPFDALQVQMAIETVMDRHRTEVKLRENETRLELALSGGDLGLWDFSLKTGRAYVDNRLAEMLGYELAELGSDIAFWRNLLPTEDVKRVDEAMQDHVKGRTSLFELEHRMRAKSGHWKWVLARGKIGSRDTAGNPLRVTGTLLDITHRRLVENITRAQRDLSRELSSASSKEEALQLCIDAALRISEMDSAGIYLANDEGGLDLAAHRGLSREFVEEVSHLGPETLNVRAVSKGRPLYSERQRLVATPGDLTEREGLKSLAVIPILVDGSVHGCLNVASHEFDSVPGSIRYSLETIASDVSGVIRRLEAEEKAGQNAARFRELAELLPQTVYEADTEGKLTFINRCGLEAAGRSDEEMARGLNAGDMVAPEHRGRIVQTFSKILDGETNVGTEYLAMRSDGTTYPVVMYSNPIFVEGKVVGVRSVCVDVRELKEAQERIKQSLKEKEVLLREIHHRVKNNLQVMSSLLRLQARYVRPGNPEKLFRAAENRIRSMALVHEKLYASRYLSNLNIDEYVRSLVNTLKASYGISSSKVVFEQDIEAIELDLDTAMPVGFIVTELISNCLMHAFPNGRRGKISISLRALAEDRFVLVVTDDGVGMKGEVDLDNPTSFGLHLVRTLTEQMDGAMELTTGGGTEFRITFKEIRRVAGRSEPI